MTGTIYCISAITSRFDFVSDFLTSNIVRIVSVCIVYEFAFITTNMSLGCLAIIRLLCLVNISWIEESIGELLIGLIHLSVSVISGIGSVCYTPCLLDFHLYWIGKMLIFWAAWAEITNQAKSKQITNYLPKRGFYVPQVSINCLACPNRGKISNEQSVSF
jgi:hypothetical protein